MKFNIYFSYALINDKKNEKRGSLIKYCIIKVLILRNMRILNFLGVKDVLISNRQNIYNNFLSLIHSYDLINGTNTFTSMHVAKTHLDILLQTIYLRWIPYICLIM